MMEKENKMNTFNVQNQIEEYIPEGCGELVSDCCYCYLGAEFKVGEITICPDCLDHCEAVNL
jgi:hypothetical protein